MDIGNLIISGNIREKGRLRSAILFTFVFGHKKRTDIASALCMVTSYQFFKLFTERDELLHSQLFRSYGKLKACVFCGLDNKGFFNSQR